MKLKTLMMGAAATAVMAPAAFAERGADGQVNIIMWQAPSTMNMYLSGGTKDIIAASMTLEPLARFTPEGKVVPWLAAEVPTAEIAPSSHRFAAVGGPGRAGGVLHHGQASRPAQLHQRVHVGGDTGLVHGDHRGGGRRDGLLDGAGGDVEGGLLDLGEHRVGAHVANHVGGGDERQ